MYRAHKHFSPIMSAEYGYPIHTHLNSFAALAQGITEKQSEVPNTSLLSLETNPNLQHLVSGRSTHNYSKTKTYTEVPRWRAVRVNPTSSCFAGVHCKHTTKTALIVRYGCKISAKNKETRAPKALQLKSHLSHNLEQKWAYFSPSLTPNTKLISK